MVTKTRAVGLLLLIVAVMFPDVDAFARHGAAQLKALHEVDQAWVKAYTAVDADAAAALYDEDAILMPPGTSPVHGRAAVRAFLAPDMAASKKAGVTFHLGPKPDGGISGSLGWVSGTYSVTDASGKVVDTGKYLSVSKKQHGKWLYIRDIWNSDKPKRAMRGAEPNGT